jgi:hypothetical protein
MSKESTTASGIGLGNVLAAIISYSITHSILWAFFHGMLGWIYVIYRAIVGISGG